MVSWIGPSKPRRSAITLKSDGSSGRKIHLGRAEGEPEVLRLAARDQTVAVQRAAAERQVFHGDGHFMHAGRHRQIQERIAAGAAGALDRENILGQRLVAGRSSFLPAGSIGA